MLHSDIQRRMTALPKQLGVAALYALLIHLDHRYLESGTPVSSFEAASGFALAVLLLGGKRYAWGVFLGAFLISLTTAPLGAAAISSSGHALEALCGAWLITRNHKFDPAIQSLRDYLRLFFLGGGAGVGIVANLAVTALLASGFIPSGFYLHELLHWWTGDMLGIVLITPLILVCWRTQNEWREVKQVAEAMLLLGLTFVAGQIVFFGWFHDSLGHVARGYVMFLFITWVAVRLGTRGTVIALTMIATQSLLGAFQGVGFFADDIVQSQLANYWFFTLILSVTGMALATFIAERKRAEETVRASEARLQEIINLMPVALFIKDSASRIILMNHTCEEQWGISFPDLRGTDASRFFPPEQMAFFLAKDREVFANRHQVDFEETAWSASRKENRVMHTYKKPVFDEAGDPLYLIGMSIDITEKKRAEEVLKQSKLIIDNTIDGFWMSDMMGYLREANAAYARMSGYSVDELIGMHISQLEAIEKSREEVEAHGKKIIAQGSDKFETRHRHKDGHEIDLEVSVNFMPEARRFFVFLRDITGRKAAEQQLRALSVHMLEVREEEKASIARDIHDELGGTLTALKIDAYWLSRKLPVNEETAGLVERIKSMSQQIDDAISVTRRVISDLRPTLLDDLGLLPALEWQAAEFHKHTGIECQVNCIENEANLDKQRSISLFRILQEALTNISRHSGASKAKIEFHHSEKEVILTISDNGRGMEKGHIITSKSYGMLGMTERTEQLGGKIIFSSPPDGGFSVAVILPLPAEKWSI